MYAAPLPPSTTTVAWPQDDSYRGHIDATWLRVLGMWISSVQRYPPLAPWRTFYVLPIHGG